MFEIVLVQPEIPPNTGNVIRPGVPVTVMFGNLRMEPILAQ